MIDVLIVGAGIAGLMAANLLKENGFHVLVVDKGRGVGGRMATRRIGKGRADHGAQFFTVRDPVFGAHVEKWLASNVIHRWSSGWSDGTAASYAKDGFPRYVGSQGMTAVPKFLAESVTVQLQTRLIKVTAVDNEWQAVAENGTVYKSQALLMTPPVPQTLDVLDYGGVTLSSENRDALERITYAPCIAGLFLIDGGVRLPHPGALQRSDAQIPWIADNQRKGISPDCTLITLHSNPELSWTLWNVGYNEKVATLKKGLRPFLKKNSTILEAQAHRWRFSRPTTLHPERTLIADNLPPLAFAGDAFHEPRVEGAALSGLAAATALANRLRP
jgi:renalase